MDGKTYTVIFHYTKFLDAIKPLKSDPITTIIKNYSTSSCLLTVDFTHSMDSFQVFVKINENNGIL